MLPTIQISSEIHVPTYYLVICVVVALCLLWIVRRSRQKNLNATLTLDLSLLIMVFGFIGGRLFHVFYENLNYYQENYLRILYFWDGGFVFYGGALLSGAVGIGYLYFKAHDQMEKYLDLLAPVLALGYGLGRIACFLAGCCYGRACDLPWAVSGKHPAQLYAVLWELGVVLTLIGLEKARSEIKLIMAPGRIFYTWMIFHGVGRLIMESFRDDFRGPTVGFSISSWISWGLIILGLLLLWKKPLDSNG
ncbi:prolipoprotein diacylglyceryl transferase [Bdellovibrio sp. SKB1291214]|uniref:prolipoprotein diacylglyceryl transferase n=1 Tax=Bdellovibrio sp. SKB1291214 TaxID=1732569 RepID=UPI000B51C14F|nr:prolipoprotein diacylglyceryl transferase [Bdellovibrio sp. SKB1291214]UYL08762.1 prolipoprotein diacylglyceryl transferase [Bdellovibrio sp. SKB1291214]